MRVTDLFWLRRPPLAQTSLLSDITRADSCTVPSSLRGRLIVRCRLPSDSSTVMGDGKGGPVKAQSQRLRSSRPVGRDQHRAKSREGYVSSLEGRSIRDPEPEREEKGIGRHRLEFETRHLEAATHPSCFPVTERRLSQGHPSVISLCSFFFWSLVLVL